MFTKAVFLFTESDGAYSITTLGTLLFTVLFLAVVIAATLLIGKKKDEKLTNTASVRKLTFSAISIAIAFTLSCIKLFPMPWGGSVTLFSMFFITIVGYWYGLGTGLMVAFAYSILQFFQDGGSYILTPLQVCCDYFFAFAALGLSGFFRSKKNGIVWGYLTGVLGRLVFASIAGYLYWMDYMPDSFPKSLSAVYPILYNLAYLGVEAVLTLVVYFIPAVKNTITKITNTYVLSENR